MPSFGSAVERTYEQLFAVVEPVSLRSLHRAVPVSPRGSTRALQAALLARAAERKPWSVILCRFKNETPVPNVERFYRSAFAPGTGGMIEYWRDVSLGAIDIADSRVFGWVEVDITRDKAGVSSGESRGTLIDRAIAAARRQGDDPITGFHSQVAVYTENWSKAGAPVGVDWSDPVWGPFWIDGSSDGRRVCMTPPHNGNILAHEMGHGFAMNHDLAPDLISDYADVCCIMSQRNPFTHPALGVAFGPAVCLPHLRQRGWMFKRRIYEDGGGWMTLPDGVSVPLAPLDHPRVRAHLGIRLGYRDSDRAWDYFLEYIQPTRWNRGLPQPLLVVRRIAPHAAYGETPAYLGSVAVPAAMGQAVSLDEASGNVRFTVERFSADGRVITVNARKL